MNCVIIILRKKIIILLKKKFFTRNIGLPLRVSISRKYSKRRSNENMLMKNLADNHLNGVNATHLKHKF